LFRGLVREGKKREMKTQEVDLAGGRKLFQRERGRHLAFHEREGERHALVIGGREREDWEGKNRFSWKKEILPEGREKKKISKKERDELTLPKTGEEKEDSARQRKKKKRKRQRKITPREKKRKQSLFAIGLKKKKEGNCKKRVR